MGRGGVDGATAHSLPLGAKMAIMKPEMEALSARFKAEQAADQTAADRFKHDTEALMKKHNASPLKMFAGPLFQVCASAPL